MIFTSILQEAKKQNFRKLKNTFVIHEHAAERAGLHYDLRLEKDGVYKSWATRKLPKLIDGETKRIALFPTPDHEMIEYDREGYIEDDYGKGLVKIWDRGKYDLLKWKENHIIVRFKGKKTQGVFVIIMLEDRTLFFRSKKYK